MKNVFGKVAALAAFFTCALSANVFAQNQTLSYQGYSLKWQDEFEGTELNRDDWNVELHQRGWVNNEMQQYVDSDENIQVKDGKLILRPVTKNAKKNLYTSGRVNTQGKHDFKYGIIECRAKFPAGKGFLPAFWMMPTNEQLYGQWPLCGEIDIAEVLGHDTSTVFGTIHYGNPHNESQGKANLGKNAFSDDFHNFACEWEPGRISWYVDGNLLHTENDWFSKASGKTALPYPAPFNQPFYIILNLAVGGDWPGSPEKNATYIDGSAFEIDYVRVYQKASYNENVAKPQKVLNLKKADSSGNFVTNGDFSVEENLGDETDWQFLTAASGDGAASIENSEIHITTKKPGSEEYSIQLVQAKMPLVQNGKYRFSFKARAAKNRTMKIGVSAPTRGWKRYLKDTAVSLTPEMKSYSFDFTMRDETDDAARIEFNMGKMGSTADVFITDIRLEQVGTLERKASAYNESADKGLIKNSAFEGELAFFETFADNSAKASCEVIEDGDNNVLDFEITNTGDMDWKVQLIQRGVSLEKGKTYVLRLKAKSTIKRGLMFAIQHDGSKDNNWDNYASQATVSLGTEFQTFEKTFKMPEDNPQAMLSVSMGAVGGKRISKEHHIYLDDITLEEVK